MQYYNLISYIFSVGIVSMHFIFNTLFDFVLFLLKKIDPIMAYFLSAHVNFKLCDGVSFISWKVHNEYIYFQKFIHNC
jgi:hypothetical protein